MNEEQKVEETKVEKSKAKFSLKNLLGGKNNKEFWENLSFLIIIFSGILVAIGIGIGSFIQGTILIASFGAFFVMVGIVVFIVSQFIEEVK